MTRTNPISGLSIALFIWLAIGVLAAAILRESTIFGKAEVWGILLPATTLAWVHWKFVFRCALRLLQLGVLSGLRPRPQALYVRPPAA